LKLAPFDAAQDELDWLCQLHPIGVQVDRQNQGFEVVWSYKSVAQRLKFELRDKKSPALDGAKVLI